MGCDERELREEEAERALERLNAGNIEAEEEKYGKFPLWREMTPEATEAYIKEAAELLDPHLAKAVA